MKHFDINVYNPSEDKDEPDWRAVFYPLKKAHVVRTDKVTGEERVVKVTQTDVESPLITVALDPEVIDFDLDGDETWIGTENPDFPAALLARLTPTIEFLREGGIK